MSLMSGQFSSTTKASIDVTAIDSQPTGIEHGDADPRLGIFFLLSSMSKKMAQPQRPHPDWLRSRYVEHRAPKRIPITVYPSIVRNEDGTWTLTWAGSGPFEIWLDGDLLESGYTSTTYTYTGGVYIDDAPPIEVVESGGTAFNSLHPPMVQVQWRGLAGADGYVIEKLDGTWGVVANFVEDGSGYYRWTDSEEADSTTHEYRVTGVRAGGGDGTPIAFDIFLVRNPRPPAVVVTINTSGDVVVSAP
jgi:hypothetical protein